MLHQTALHATHEALGATLVDFGGWDMPLWYPTGAVKEHLAVIQHAGLFDIGHMAGLMVSGPRCAGGPPVGLYQGFVLVRPACRLRRVPRRVRRRGG